MIYTNLFPVLTCLGFTSSDLNAANMSSAGEASNECGPVKSKGTLSFEKMLSVDWQV